MSKQNLVNIEGIDTFELESELIIDLNGIEVTKVLIAKNYKWGYFSYFVDNDNGSLGSYDTQIEAIEAALKFAKAA